MPHELTLSPAGHLALVERSAGSEDAHDLPPALVAAFAEGPAPGMLHLATADLQAGLPPAPGFVRSFACAYLSRLCQTQGHEASKDLPPTAAPPDEELAAWVAKAPPMTGLEYLRAETLADWWADLDAFVRDQIGKHAG